MEIFLRLATRHHFPAGSTPEAQPRDTGHSDALDTQSEVDFYDDDEMNFFHQFEMQLNWDIGN